MTPSVRYRVLFALVALALALVLFGITQYPYRYADRHAPEGTRFIGEIAMMDDINSYFSFIQQAAHGHLVFHNAMTHLEHEPVFVNLEWLAAGIFMRVFGWSTRTTFEAWRFAGAVSLLSGFAALTLALPMSTRERLVALGMCAFGGGFGWFLFGLSKLGWVDISAQLGLLNPAMDLITPIHPFGQITKNPHFSLPHGTFLLVMAAYVVAENGRSPRWYGVAAVMAVLHGLIRPYDIISLWAFLPVFMALESFRARSWCVRQNLWRALPLAATAPVLLYYVYIFSLHPVFKSWSSQGVQPPMPLGWHLLALGLAGVLFVYRLVRFRTYPLATPSERLLAVWALVTLVLVHSNRVLPFMPYTPQLAVPMITAIILVSAGAFRPRDHGAARPAALAALALFLVLNALTSPFYLQRAASAAASNKSLYVHVEDLKAIDWLKDHVREQDVILSNYAMGTKLGQLLPARVVLGHWALTPHVDALGKRIDQLIDGRLEPGEAAALLAELRARYLYVPNPRRWARAYPPGAIPGIRLVYDNPSIAIYEVRRMPEGHHARVSTEAAWL
ncbi:MAG: hypothetical protein IT364_07360 [Candidatus Hydrogenedentes bacterium]|nr:hypothetical protein [Candidatus Hydrogenedentota bacterium]